MEYYTISIQSSVMISPSSYEILTSKLLLTVRVIVAIYLDFVSIVLHINTNNVNTTEW